jgi:ketosteroid isomerase-like protein
MSVALPQPIAAYFAATNAHGVRAMVESFAEDAVVRDEGKQHQGLDDIRAWMHETIAKYDFTVEPTDVTETGGKTIVTALVSGTFPGSPASIRHAFTLNRGKIVLLEIG